MPEACAGGKGKQEGNAGEIEGMTRFVLQSGDKEMINSFKGILSEYSRKMGHIYDAQLDEIDHWQAEKRKRKEELIDAIQILTEDRPLSYGDIHVEHGDLNINTYNEK